MPYVSDVDTLWEQEQLAWFGGVVRQARLGAGLGQRGLAERSGVSQSTISRLERGKVSHFPLVRLLSLAQAVGPMLPVGVCPHDHVCRWPVRSPGPVPMAIDTWELLTVLEQGAHRRAHADDPLIDAASSPAAT